METEQSLGTMMFTLKRVLEDPGVWINTSVTPRKRRLSKDKSDCGNDDEGTLLQALRSKPWIRYDEYEISSEDESDSEAGNPATGSSSLPVGVVRGCSSCEGCQKVLVRWRPEAGCRPVLEDAPVFFPLEEEFEDTVKYIASIRAEAEQYGICRIVPPHSWRPPCLLKDSVKRTTPTFPTRVQQLDKLQVRKAKTKKIQKKKRLGRQRDGYRNGLLEEDAKFGFEPGPLFTLEAFEKYAHQFKEDYFELKDRNGTVEANVPESEPSVESIEGEYWRIVEHATEKIEVLYGADIETGIFGSGFPKSKAGAEPSSYERSGWNLNNIARLPGSVLSFEKEEISGVLVPWLYVGMCFSSFCWHVEDHHFYSLNYMHFGSPKVWYGVPANAADKLEDAMKKYLPDLFEEQPDLLHKLVTQLSPSVLKAAGVPVYRAVQKAGEFIITFPRAYHAGFNCGFNCAEAVNVAPIDWLPSGQIAVELYKQQKRKSTVSHDKILLETAKKALISSDQIQNGSACTAWKDIFNQQNEILLKVLKNRVDLEHIKRAKVEEFVQVRKMDSDFDAIDLKECFVCHYDLHLSAVGCECAHERYTCLEHFLELCACDKARKYALYRYELPELNALVLAVGGSPVDISCFKELLKTLPEQKSLESSKDLQDCGLKHKSYHVPVDLCAEPNDICFGENTFFPAVPEASLSDDVPKIAISMPKESIWSIDFSGLNSFLKDLEESDQLAQNSNGTAAFPFKDSSKPSACPFSGNISEEKGNVEMIVLSDDEDGIADQSSFNSSHKINSTNVVSQLPASHEQGCWTTTGSQLFALSGKLDTYMRTPDENDAFVCQQPPLTYQDTVQNFVPPKNVGFIPNGGVAVDLICESHLPGSNFNGGCFQFSAAKNERRNIVEVGDAGGFLPSSSSSQPHGCSLHVDLLSTGRLVFHTFWYNKDVIFPAGFRSRVLFPSILDPCQTCFYISEILDCGSVEPLFKVAMEGYPSEVFVHSSIDRCWQMVQERINIAIQHQHALGRMGLPLPVRPEDISGIDMFGFTSPHIIKAVESLDWRHECLEYWTGRVSAIELLQNQHRQCTTNTNVIQYEQDKQLRISYYRPQEHSNPTVMEPLAPNNDFWL